MSTKINLEVNAFTNIQSLVKKINDATAGKNVSGIFYNKKSLVKGEIEIQLLGDVNVVEVPVAKGKGTGSSRYRGVFWVKGENKWRAMIGYKGKRYPLGRYTNEEEAARAYDKKAFELLGGDAFLNFPLENDDSLKIGDKVKVIDLSKGALCGVLKNKSYKVKELNCEGKFEVEIERNGFIAYTDISNLKKVCD